MYPKFSLMARRAIQIGVEQGDPVSNLEWLGLPPRVLQQLADNNIVKLGDLLSKGPEELLKIEAFGPKSLRVLYQTLSRYHELEATEEEEEKCLDPDMRRRIDTLRI